MVRKSKPMKKERMIEGIWRHIFQMLRLAPTIVLTRTGLILIVLVDTAMVGQYDVVELGFLAMGMSLFQPLLVTSIGLIMGTLVLSAHENGASNFHECGKIAVRSVAYSMGLGFIGVFISLFGESYLLLFGQ